MIEFPKPKVVISNCPGVDARQFTGEILQGKFVPKLEGLVDFLPASGRALRRGWR